MYVLPCGTGSCDGGMFVFCDTLRFLEGGLNHVLTISNRILREKCADRYQATRPCAQDTVLLSYFSALIA